MGAKTTLRTEPASTAHPTSTAWIPRAVRCSHCGELAREEVRERLSDDEVAVRYGCSSCRWHQTRHYHESELERDNLN